LQAETTLETDKVCTIGSAKTINALTIDVEDYFQVSGFQREIRRDDWPRFTSRVVINTQRLLAICRRWKVKATFFVLGWVAERHPDLIREIAAAGHEIGSHSYWHRLVYEQSPAEFRDDLRRSQDAIERSIGRRAKAYRAPSFSITRRSLWALEILVDEGFSVDSSIFPVYHDRYGIPDAPLKPHWFQTPAGAIIEFPASVVQWGRISLPVSGGGYFRLAPYRVTEAFLSRINSREGRPFVFYVHPWEIDPEQPRLKAGSRQSRFRHYLNLSTTASKLERLLSQFSFGTISQAIEGYLAKVECLTEWTGSAVESGKKPAIGSHCARGAN